MWNNSLAYGKQNTYSEEEIIVHFFFLMKVFISWNNPSIEVNN